MRRSLVVFIACMLAVPLLASTALGHERRTVGQYALEVGWLEEPALAGLPNAVSLTVTDHTKSDAPVEGLQGSLKAEVLFGGLTRSLAVAFRPIEDQPGHYAADVIPTKEGTYTFHIFGTIGTQNVDERFESGPNRFDDVEKVTALQYPDPVPNGADLADRLATLQSGIEQLRALAVAAIVIAIVGPIGATLLARRRAT